MKKTVAIMVLFCTCALNTKPDVELWNKSRKTFYALPMNQNQISLITQQKVTDQNFANQLKAISPNDRITTNKINTNDTVALFITDKRNDPYIINYETSSTDKKAISEGFVVLPYFEFAPNKDIYVRIKSDAKNASEIFKNKFGPQSGPLSGLKGVTETGLPLKNNVKSKDIAKKST
ncbi:MAG: hypothetical protein WD055_00570 [Candidatus Dependentiae bacterium]